MRMLRMTVSIPHNLGCVNYMAPEYYGNNGYQSEVDIWGFGMCVIEMATLSIPFAEEFGNSVDAIKEAVGNVCCSIELADSFARSHLQGLKPHSFARIDQPLDMIDLIAICLHSDPQKRYSAEELLRHPFIEMGAEDEDGQDPFLNQYIKLVPQGEGHEPTSLTEQAWEAYTAKKLAPLYDFVANDANLIGSYSFLAVILRGTCILLRMLCACT